MTTDRGHGIPRTSRPFEHPVSLPVTDRRATVPPDPSFLAAGADIPEADAAQRIAADPSVIDAERDPLYGDGVEDAPKPVGIVAQMQEAFPCMDPEKQEILRARRSERIRRERLSRWQEQR